MITRVLVAIASAVLGYFVASYFSNRILESANQQAIDLMLPQVIVTSALIKARTTPPEPKTLVTEVPKEDPELEALKRWGVQLLEQEANEAYIKLSDETQNGWELHVQSGSEDPNDPVFNSLMQLQADITQAHEDHFDRLNEALAKLRQHEA